MCRSSTRSSHALNTAVECPPRVRTLSGARSQLVNRCAGSLRRISWASTSGCRNLSFTKSARLSAMRSLFLGITAVRQKGMPKGCRNKATTANQSASPPTMAASAPAFSKRNQKVGGCVSVYAKTRVANTRMLKANAFLRFRYCCFSIISCHKANGARHTNRTACLGRNVGVQQAAHAHVFALYHIYLTVMWPSDVAQIPRKGRGCRARGRVFINAARGKRIARVKPLRRFRMGKRDRDQVFTPHKVTPLVQRVGHRSQRFTAVKAQQQVVSTAMDTRRRNTGVQVCTAIAKQSKPGVNKCCRGGRAVRRRRLQSRHQRVALLAPFHRDVGLV